MHFKEYTDVHEFYHDTYDVLMNHEAQNMILLGNLIMGHVGKDKTEWRDPANWFMATIVEGDEILLTAMMTPPHNLTLYATGNEINQEAIQCLIDELKDQEILGKIPGVMTEKALAESFANAYTAHNNGSYKVKMNQRIYELTEVNSAVPMFGKVRLLAEKDMHYFPYWVEAFNGAAIFGKTEMAIPQEGEVYRYRIEQKKLYVLEHDGVPVSMAGFTREMQTAIGVAYVYTPPYYRGKGYATSLVAQISQLALDKGYTKCVLYTDLANPTSNSIYQKIGYVPICDSLMLEFIDKESAC